MQSRKPFAINRPLVQAVLFTLAVCAPGLWGSPCAAQDQAVEKSAFKDEREKASYAFGMSLALGWKKQDVEMDPEAIARAMKDVQSGAHPSLTEGQMNQTLAKFTQELRILQRQRHDQKAESNRGQGTSFLEHNQAQDGVVTLPSGLQYKVLAEGAGPSPVLTNWVSLKFRGTRIDGTEFETSYGYPEPNSYCLTSVIPAWAEALQKMRPGAEWQLFVPPTLAYGENGSHTVGPNETLIYDLTLVSVYPSTAKDIRTAQPPDND